MVSFYVIEESLIPSSAVLTLLPPLTLSQLTLMNLSTVFTPEQYHLKFDRATLTILFYDMQLTIVDKI